MVTSDAHAGLVAAIGATLPAAAWQRCRTHYAANLMAATPKPSWPWVRTLLHSIYDQPGPPRAAHLVSSPAGHPLAVSGNTGHHAPHTWCPVQPATRWR